MQNPQNVEMSDMLGEIMDNLGKEEFGDFKWFLKNSEIITEAQQEEANRKTTVDLLMKKYPLEAVDKTIKCLKKIKRNDLVLKLSPFNPGEDQPKNKRLDEVIVETVAASKERGGSSIPALSKALVAQGYDGDKNNARIMTTINRMVDRGTLVQTKGTGALKMNKKADTKAKKQAKKTTPKAEKLAIPKPKKPAATQSAAPKELKTPAAKKPAAKKPADKKPAAKKPADKKPADKKPAAKTPAAKKPAAEAPAAKKPAAKTPAAKKPAAKKPKTPATKQSQTKGKMSAVTKRAAKKVPPLRAKKVAKPKAKKAAPRKK